MTHFQFDTIFDVIAENSRLAVFKHAETKGTSMFYMYTSTNNCSIKIMASLLPLSYASTNIIFENESITDLQLQRLLFSCTSHAGRRYVVKVVPEQIWVGLLFRNSNVNMGEERTNQCVILYC